jgi:hypothetical protein
VVAGRTFTGPLRLVTRWTVKELSVCPIGADPAAKARAERQATVGGDTPGQPPHPAGNPEPQKKDSAMDKRLRAFLERRGLPTTATEEEAQRFLEQLEAQSVPDLDAERAAAATAERGRVAEITAMCRQHGCDAIADQLIKDGVTIDASRAAVLEHLTKKQTPEATPGFRVSVGTDERDKFRGAAEQGLLLRAGMKVDTPVAGAADLRGYSLRELARHSLLLAGEPTGGDVMQMVGRAMITTSTAGTSRPSPNRSTFTSISS